MRFGRWPIPGLLVAALAGGVGLDARDASPRVRFLRAPRVDLPGKVDSNNPFVWYREGSTPVLSAITSWGGVPELATGPSIEGLAPAGGATFRSHPGHGVWFEAVVPDHLDRWYGFYHHERPASDCGRPDRQLPRVGAARSTDHGRTWDDLGIVLDAPPGSAACLSSNGFTLGGVGDVSAMLDRDARFLYLYFSQYVRDPRAQGVAVARLAWADRDAPAGKAEVWADDVWLPPRREPDSAGTPVWTYPIGTVLVPPSKPFHDGADDADVFWGPALHWNTYLERYVLMLNRAADERYRTEGIYVSYADALDRPRAWSAPVRVIAGGEWYPQVVGLEAGLGTDRLAGRFARLFLTGRSSLIVEFVR